MITPDPTPSSSLALPCRDEELQPVPPAAASDQDNNDIEELVEFLHLIDTLPESVRPDFYRALDRLVKGFERRQRILNHIRESLSQMNLDLKYLIFDLEATRRERDHYKSQL